MYNVKDDTPVPNFNYWTHLKSNLNVKIDKMRTVFENIAPNTHLYNFALGVTYISVISIILNCSKMYY